MSRPLHRRTRLPGNCPPVTQAPRVQSFQSAPHHLENPTIQHGPLRFFGPAMRLLTMRLLPDVTPPYNISTTSLPSLSSKCHSRATLRESKGGLGHRYHN